ncbi:MAG: DUF4351 domain-containing protein [Acidobacteriota bacterium]
MQKHDGLWKELLRSFFPEFLKLAAPKVAAALVGEEPRFLEQESLTDLLDGVHVRMDLVAEVRRRGKVGSLVIVHIEVERDFGESMDRRVFRYFAHLKLKLDLPIIPIVLFLRGGPPGVERRHYREVVEDLVVVDFTYVAVGLSKAAAEDFLNTSPLGAALASCTRGDKLPIHERKYRCVEAILDAGVNDAQQMLLLNAVETYLQLLPEDQLKYDRRVNESPKGTEVLRMEMTWAEKLHQKGHREGVALGRREGVALGHREGVESGRRMLLRLMASRFGTPSDPLKARIRSLSDLEEIERLSERVLEAETLAELGLGDTTSG